MTIFEKSSLFALLAVVALLGPRLATAQPGEHGDHRGPPPAAFDACKGKKAGDACEVSFGERKGSGKCEAMPEGKLACRIAPPPEMLKACEGKKEGDTCSATMGDRKIDGTCQKGRMSDKLICRGARK